MKSRFLHDLNEMPGPVWLFGAFGITRLAGWFFALFMQGVDGLFWFSWPSAGMRLLGLAAALLPAGLFWCMVRRRPYAMSLVRWYAALQVLAHGISLLSPLITGYDAELYGGYGGLVRSSVTNLTWGALWFVFLYYLERSEKLAGLMPAGNRRALWWTVVPMAALVFLCM